MSPELFLLNLTSPPILFFAIGIAAALVRSDLEIPPAISKLFSIYLLWAIGFKGGVALRESGLSTDQLATLFAAIAFSALTPLAILPALKKKFGFDNATALAACYGSVSVVTFMTASNFLDAQSIEHSGGMIACLALMEAPPIITALILRGFLKKKIQKQDQNQTDPTEDKPLTIGAILHESFTSGPVFLLLASLAAGAITGPAGFEPFKPFCYDIFNGVLVLFLLDAGTIAGAKLKDIKNLGPRVVVAAILIPLANAAVAIPITLLLGLSTGDAVLFITLAASASYIAVPAAMRLAVPGASPSVYLPMSLGLTFTFNVTLGIPLYLVAIQAITPA